MAVHKSAIIPSVILTINTVFELYYSICYHFFIIYGSFWIFECFMQKKSALIYSLLACSFLGAVYLGLRAIDSSSQQSNDSDVSNNITNNEATDINSRKFVQIVAPEAIRAEASTSAALSLALEDAVAKTSVQGVEPDPRSAQASSLANGEMIEQQLMHDIVTLSVRVLSQPGRTAIKKRAYEIPDGWDVTDMRITNKKGRARIFRRDGYVILEVHALSPNDSERTEAYAQATISISRQEIDKNSINKILN